MRLLAALKPGSPLRRRLGALLPAPMLDRMRRYRHARRAPPLGAIDFGDLARTTPISPHFGYMRGTSIDRHYIEPFLERHRADIHGRVLEVATAVYARRYGHDLAQVDELDLVPGPGIAFAGDIGVEGLLPTAAFDCIVFTQTLQYVFEPATALAQLHRALKPGGVLLATIPVITPLDLDECSWLWTFTPRVAHRLFDATFGPDNCEIAIHGNVFAATCFLHGIVVEDVDPAWLDPVDPCYPITITIRAVKPAA